MLLWSVLTTIPRPSDRPEKIVDLGFREGTKVEIPYLDSRTCDGIKLNMHDEAVEALFDYGAGRDKTLAVALKVYYRDRVVYHAPLSEPDFDYEQGIVTLASKQTVRIENAYLNTTDLAVTSGITADGDGMLALLDSAQNTAPQDALNWPSLGIIRGDDSTTESDVVRKLTIGDQIFQSIKDLADIDAGPDFEIAPFESDPAELASTSVTASPEATIPSGVVTDYSLVVSAAGKVSELRVGVWAEHTRPTDLDVELRHPDGTVIRLYTGSRDDDNSGSGWLGSSSTATDLCRFWRGQTAYHKPFPHVGTFRSATPTGTLRDKLAAGTWKLRIRDNGSGATGTLHHFRLDFILPEPAYARMNVSDKPITDDPGNPPIPTCVFNSGHGTTNARIFTVKPQGALTRNQFIARSKAGRAIKTNDVSRAEIGTYQGYEAAEPQDSLALLAAFAKAQVDAYGRPPPFLDLAPVDDTGENDTLRYGEDFFVGKHVLAEGKRGQRFDLSARCIHSILARVVKVTLTNQRSSVRTDMDVIPSVGLASEVADG